MSSLYQTDGCQNYSDVDESSSSSGSININSYVKDVTKSAIKGSKRGNSRKKKKAAKSQHSLDSLRQRVSHLMSIFEDNGWFIPMPDFSGSNSMVTDQNHKGSKQKGGKVWSNRNYGADKKRQRKQSERIMLEVRIQQLEATLKNDHGVENL